MLIEFKFLIIGWLKNSISYKKKNISQSRQKKNYWVIENYYFSYFWFLFPNKKAFSFVKNREEGFTKK
jgi:hypothetical protein